jgi:hypothetical protein
MKGKINHPIQASCPLCGNAQASKHPFTGDWSRYECPNDETFDIAGTEEALVIVDRDLAAAHRERIARERERDSTKIPKVGQFPAKLLPDEIISRIQSAFKSLRRVA